MLNLLRTLTTSKLHSESDLLFLLKAVKDGRTCDAKLSDPFYDSLEGLLLDLRTVTIDNHDADAFLKPVSKLDVPDYYDVISSPMDLQTMLKRVKQKHYKSLREFKDDLDLIWNNCYTYNAALNHPLRPCAARLQIKAAKLLHNITDRKDRTDPPDLALTRTKPIRLPNGHPVRTPKPKKPTRDLPFADSPALTRTPSGMSTFAQLQGPLTPSVVGRLRELVEYESGSDDGADAGQKRKLTANHRPRKRSRLNQDDLWWRAVQSDALLANGVPSIPCLSSSPQRTRIRPRKKQAVPSLLTAMNANIRTMKRVRRTHAKFAALNVNAATDDADDAVTTPHGLPGADDADDALDERPWLPRRAGIDIGQESAADCLHWMGAKVLEHAGFQGTSSVALDVLASVTAEYLLNVGRTIRYLRDKYARSMTAEEIILHTLFESGTAKIQDLERYIKDDVVRYGARLGDLEKKLVGAYREATVVDALDDDALFGNEEDEEEEGAFVMGNFADAFGEDFLGLRELGIAAEHGLSNLSIPKRLLKGKGTGASQPASAAGPAEPPPPFPPPPPFVPLAADKVDAQIGLLRPYYHARLAALAAPAYALPAGLYGHPLAPVPPPVAPALVLPDDAPSAAQAKMGPLGQIVRGAPLAGKKKAKRKDAPVPSEAEVSPGKKKPGTGKKARLWEA